MILTLDAERLRTLAELGAFLDGSDPVDFRLTERDDAYAFRAADTGAVPVRGVRQAGQGVAQTVSGQGDGIVAGAADTADRPVPGDGTDRGSPPGTRAAVRAALHGGGHPPSGGDRRDPRRPVRRRHQTGDATPVRGLRGRPLRASGGTLQQPPLPPAREHDLPSATGLDGQDTAGADRHRRAPQAASRRPTGLPARRLRAPGRPRRREGHLSDQRPSKPTACGRRSPSTSSSVPSRPSPKPSCCPSSKRSSTLSPSGSSASTRTTRRAETRRLGVHQPPRRLAARQAPCRGVHQVAAAALQRQRPRREQERHRHPPPPRAAPTSPGATRRASTTSPGTCCRRS